MIQREIYQSFKKRIEEKRLFIQLLTGPRQVGKTTLIKQILNDISIGSIYLSADAIGNTSQYWISQQWEAARIKLNQSQQKEFILVIDEIQKIENWSEIVKKEWDSDTLNKIYLKVVLLGSSRIQLQKGLTESLTGRFENTFLPHWSFHEMQEAFNFDVNQYIWFGGYPGIAPIIQDEKRWKEYVTGSLIETSLSKDILMMNRIDKPALLKRLFELGCLYSGQILSFSKIVGQLQDAGNTTTLSNYLKLLDSAGMLAGIEKTYTEKIRSRASSPKFQVYNNGLMNALRDETFHTALNQPHIWGRIVESAVGAHLINYARSEGYLLEYWRQRNDEIDFVIRYDNKTIGIEVKSNAVFKTSGMFAFTREYNPYKVLLVGDGGLPVGEFLKINPVKLFE
jgi:uncharacterized protein